MNRISIFEEKVNEKIKIALLKKLSNPINIEFEFSKILPNLFEEIYQSIISEQDDIFFNSNERKNNYVSRGFVNRTITTIFGTATIKRRKYRHKDTKEYYYIDNLVNIEKYKRLSKELIFQILEKYMYTSAIGLAKNYSISRQTIYNQIYSFKNIKLDIQKYPFDSNFDTVYIEVDEDHTRCIENKSTYTRTLTIHLGIEKECKNRSKLIDKHVFSFPTKTSIEDVGEYVLNYLYSRYNMNKKRLIVNSDGAKWIEAFVNELSVYNPIHIYDKFHLIKLIRLIAGRDGRLRNKIRKLIEKNDKKSIEKLRETFSEEKKQKYFGTILNQWNKIEKIYSTNNYYGSRTEALVSHHCSKFLSSRPKAFAKEKLKARTAYLNFFINFGNNIELLRDYYFNNVRVEEINKIIAVDDDFNITYDIKSISTNIPAKNSTNKFLSEMLKNISHETII